MSIVEQTSPPPSCSGANDLRFSLPRFGRCLIKYPALVQHTAQPTRVHHIKDLLGAPICTVETDDFNVNKTVRISFPPNNYDEIKIRNASKRLPALPHFSTTNVLMTARPALDTILSLNHFTGLRNMSFKSKSNFNLKRIKSLEGWENELKSLAVCALDPFLNESPGLVQRPRTMESKILCPVSPMKRMYSSSGRILLSSRNSRPITCPSRRPSSKVSVSKPISPETNSNEDQFNLQVFNILGGILQTSDDEVIKTWLLTATERERALMVDILRSALYNKEEMNIFVKDPVQDESTILYTPNTTHESNLSLIPEKTESGEADVLIVHPEAAVVAAEPTMRPPTSSVFRPSTKDSASRPRTKESIWIPQESVAVP